MIFVKGRDVLSTNDHFKIRLWYHCQNYRWRTEICYNTNWIYSTLLHLAVAIQAVFVMHNKTTHHHYYVLRYCHTLRCLELSSSNVTLIYIFFGNIIFSLLLKNSAICTLLNFTSLNLANHNNDELSSPDEINTVIPQSSTIDIVPTTSWGEVFENAKIFRFSGPPDI